MITISPITDKERLSELYNENKIEFTDAAFGVSAISGTDELGYCLFDLYEKGIEVHILESHNDLSLADGILRSALHVAAERSAMDAVYSKNAPEDLFVKLGFILDKDERKLDIDKLFGGCNCKE